MVLPHTTRTGTGKTRFSLAFSIEAIISLEIGISSFCTATYNKKEIQMALCGELDLVEEKRSNVELRNAVYKQRNAG